MEKTFGLSKVGDKMYMASVSASSLVEDDNGAFIKLLKIENIENLGDFYSYMFTLSDKSHIRVNRNNNVAMVERTPETRLEHPMAIYADFYSQSRKKLLKTVSEMLEQNITRMNNLKTEAQKIANSGIIAKGIIDALAKDCPDDEERVLSEVEFAEMAL
jgi:hypothetical protein